MENGGRMKFLEMMRKTTIVQRVMIVASIIWLLMMTDKEYHWSSSSRNHFDIGDFLSQGFIPIILVWGAYWIIIGIIEKRKNK